MKTTCIMCPLGCELDITKLKNGEIRVTGNNCVRGEKYAVSEVVAPKRNVSTLVKVGEDRVVAVKTTDAIPKNKIDDCLAELNKLVLKEMPSMGQIIVKNILNLGVDVVSINI